MSPPIEIEVEARLRFTFARPPWEAVKWDDDPAYREGIGRHDGKAVDILATMGSSRLHLIEVKDPRGSDIEYRNRVPDAELAQIVADKVRDTVAGLVFARDRRPCAHLQVHLQALFVERTERVTVIFWLEAPSLDPARALTLTSLIERSLLWLKPKVLVTRRGLWRDPPGMAGLSVESLHGAPWRG